MKQIQVDILKDIHQFCEANNLHYTLIFGSLLGAIRHKGYIPWDDDIDIAMLRPDYEKFVASYSGKNGAYRVYDYRNDVDYHHPYAKVADTRTILEERTSMKDIGINIDVFPFDNLFDTKDECNQFIKSLDGFKKKFRIKLVKPGKKNVWWKRILIRLAKATQIFWSMKKITEKEYEIVNSLSNENAKYIGVAVDPEIGPAYRSVRLLTLSARFTGSTRRDVDSLIQSATVADSSLKDTPRQNRTQHPLGFQLPAVTHPKRTGSLQAR